MRAAWIILVIAALVGGVWLLIGGGSGTDAPPTLGGTAEDPAAGPADPIRVDRLPVPGSENARGNNTDRPPETGQVEVSVQIPAPAPGMGRIRLRVVDTVTNQPVSDVRCVFVTPGARVARAPGRDGALEVLFDIPLDQLGDLVIEAEGYTPETRADFSVKSANPQVELSVYLSPVAPFSGIEIQAEDDRGVPVAHLQVTTWNTANPQRPLWVRRTAEESGTYQLPDLQPATYRLELAAVDDRGERRPLLTHDTTVTFGGSERIPVAVRFLPGALFTLTVRNPATGQIRGSEVALRMVYPDGQARPTTWRSKLEEEWLERRDGLPAAAPASLAEPLPPGSYQLSLELPGGAQQTRQVFLPAGQHTELEIQM